MEIKEIFEESFIENENEPVKIISVLITNPAIATLHKKLFEFNWINGKNLDSENGDSVSD